VREFKDEEGRPWRVALTIGSVLRVKDMVQVDVVDESTGQVARRPFDMADAGQIAQTFQVLRSQFATIGEVLYAVLVKQVEERKLSREEFLDGLRGESLEAASTVLEQELVDFFPPRLRKMVALLAQKMAEVANEMMTKAEASLEAATIESLSGQSGTASGKQQESSGSTQASGQSDSSLPLATAA
jgi:hypothetical protein